MKAITQKLESKPISDQKKSGYAQLYAYVTSDPKESMDPFMELFMEQTPVQFKMSGKLECLNLCQASKMSNANFNFIKNRFTFLRAAKARGYDQDFDLIVNCKIILLHLKGTLGNDKAHPFATQLKEVLLEYEQAINVAGTKIQGSHPTLKVPSQSPFENKTSVHPFLRKPEKKKTEPAIKAAPEPVHFEPDVDKIKCLESELRSEITVLEKINTDLNTSIIAIQNLTTEKQAQINTEIIQLKKHIEGTTSLQVALKQESLEAENLQTKELQKKIEQSAALQKSVNQLKKDNDLLNKPYLSPEAIQLEQQRIEQIHQKQIDSLKKQYLAYLAAQKEQTTALFQMEAHLKEASTQSVKQLPIPSNLKKDRAEKFETLKQQLEEVRLENLRLHTASQHFEYTVDTLNTEKLKFEAKKNLEEADFERDLKGYQNITNLMKSHLQATPPVFAHHPYALCAPLEPELPTPPIQVPILPSHSHSHSHSHSLKTHYAKKKVSPKYG